MVVVLVLLPAIGHTGNDAASWAQIAVALSVTVAKVAAFVTIMLVAGRRLVPQILHYSAHTGSRELFRLAVYAIALGIAYGASALFGVSVAVGAFFAGMVLAESALSQRATEEALPLRDAFAVLFFVSVGMLFNPHVLVERPWAVSGHADGDRRRQRTSGLRRNTPARSADRHRLDCRGKLGTDRRVLLSPGWDRRRAGNFGPGGARPDPRRRDPLDPAQPFPVHGG